MEPESNAALLLLEAAGEFGAESLPERTRGLLGCSPPNLNSALANPRGEDLLLMDFYDEPDQFVSAVAVIVSRTKQAEPLLRKSLLRPNCRFERQPKTGHRNDRSAFPVWPLFEGLVMAATLDFRSGNAEDGWRRIELALSVCARIQEPVLVDYLALTAWADFLSSTVVEACSLGPPPSKALATRIAAALLTLDESNFDHASSALRVDFARALERIEDGTHEGTPASKANRVKRLLLWGKWRRDFTHSAVAWLEYGAAGWENPTLPPIFETPLARTYSKYGPNLRASVLNRAANLRIARSVLLEVAGTPKPLPLDPWTGRPLQLKRTSEELRIWSTGQDRLDNSGCAAYEYPDTPAASTLHDSIDETDLVAVVRPPKR